MTQADIPKQIAVIIPTMGRAIIVRTLESLLRNRKVEQAEIVVVGVIPDRDVLDRLQAVISKHPQVRHLSIRYETGDASEKRNTGVRETKAPILAFLDDDVFIPESWLEQMLACFEDPGVGLVSGPSLVPEDISWIARLAGQALASRAAGDVSARYLTGGDEPRVIKWSGIIGCNMLFRRSIFDRLGGFNPRFYPGEEMLASHGVSRLGHKLVFNPRAPVYHYPKQTFRGFWRQIFRYGATRIRLIKAGVEVEWGPLVPGFWILSLLVLGIAAFFSNIAAWLLVADVVLYAAVSLGITLEVFYRSRNVLDLLLFFMQPFMHLSYGLGIWTEILRPGRDLGDELGRPTT